MHYNGRLVNMNKRHFNGNIYCLELLKILNSNDVLLFFYTHTINGLKIYHYPRR